MEKCGICTYVTHGFAVFLEAKPSEKTGKRVGYRGAHTTRFHDLTDLYYTTHAAMKSVGIRGHVLIIYA